MLVYIVLGIGADDIFVFVDAWNQSALIDPKIRGDRQRRMAYTFRRASKAMAVTSSTTSVAMFANFFGDVMPIKSFGVFAGVIVPVNFLLVVMFFPAGITLYETYIKSKPACICWGDKCTNKEGELGKVETFFDTTLNNFVHKARWFIIVLAGIWCGISAWQASEVTPASKVDDFIDREHPLMRAGYVFTEEFHAAPEGKASVTIVWGVKGYNTDDTELWDADKMGKLIWDDDFALASPEA